LLASDDGAALKRLLVAACTTPEPARWANHALGVAYAAREEWGRAATFFQQEGAHPQASGSRRRALDCLVQSHDFTRLRERLADPAYATEATANLHLQAAIAANDWPAIVRWVPFAQYQEPGIPSLILALITAVAWAFVLAHLGEMPGWNSRLALACLLAWLAGIASTTPTILAVIAQDQLSGLSPDSEDLVRTALYFIAGVGLREETCKLLFFLPALPFLLRRDSELEALLVASFVGLGFAVEENSSYFLASEGASMAGRFLTANFLHIALTGINGLALFRALRGYGDGWNGFLTAFAGTILAHGLYDLLLSLPHLDGLGPYLAMATYVLICGYYFARIQELRTHERMLLSVSGAFVVGVATVAAVMLGHLIAQLGPGRGLEAATVELIASIVLLVMFFREFNEPLAR